jgi:hypothetical protein
MNGLIKPEVDGGPCQPVAEGRTFRKLIDVPSDEVAPGDVIRDQGVFREVADVGVSVVERGLVFYFEPAEGLHGRLTVPVLEMVSVWRVCRD